MKIRVGVVGLGRAGRGAHIIECCGYPEDFELAAVCDNDAERLAMDLPDKVPAEIRPKVRRYAALEVLLADQDIDLVSIATRHPDHVPMAIKALEAGKHVFIEKPCAVSLAEMQALKKVADAHPGRLFLRHNRRNEPAFLPHIAEELARDRSEPLATVTAATTATSAAFFRLPVVA